MTRDSDALSIQIMDVMPLMVRVIRGEMRGAAQPQLTVAQFRVLARLFHAEVQTNKQLADWIGISTPSMCRTVDLLEKRGLIARHPAPEDRREILLSLTPQGKTRFSGIRKVTQRKIDERLGRLSDKKRKELLLGLSHLREVFEE
jgi:DNA-binding MarR family transcriptional regulator